MVRRNEVRDGNIGSTQLVLILPIPVCIHRAQVRARGQGQEQKPGPKTTAVVSRAVHQLRHPPTPSPVQALVQLQVRVVQYPTCPHSTPQHSIRPIQPRGKSLRRCGKGRMDTCRGIRNL